MKKLLVCILISGSFSTFANDCTTYAKCSLYKGNSSEPVYSLNITHCVNSGPIGQVNFYTQNNSRYYSFFAGLYNKDGVDGLMIIESVSKKEAFVSLDKVSEGVELEVRESNSKVRCD